MKFCTTLFICAIIFSNTYAQNGWTTYDLSNSNIGSDTVTCVYIDTSGVLFLGTIRGASKYDGINWTNYTSSNSPFNEYSTVSAIIRVRNNIYFGGMGTNPLVKFDGTNWSTIGGFPYNIFITSIDTDNSGNMWIGTLGNGVYKYDGANLVNFNSSNSPLTSNNITAIKKDNNGNIWAAMNASNTYLPAGIAEYNGSSWQLFNPGNSALTNYNVHAILLDKKGNLWFSADSLLLVKYDGTNWYRYDLSDQLSSNWFTSLAEDSSGNIWAGLGPNAPEKGIVEFDGNKATYFGQQQSFPSTNQVNDLKIDKYNNKWIGSWGNGLIKFNRVSQISFTNSITGDSLNTSTLFYIQWSYSFVDNIKLDYSTDDGNTWLPIAANIPAYYLRYNWIVPVVAPYSNKCKIRISDASNQNLFAVSDSTFTIYSKVSTPTFSPQDSLSFNSVLVNMHCLTDSAEIYYTTDGSEPNQNSALFTSAIYIDSGVTFHARAFRKNWVASDIIVKAYTMKAGDITFSPQPGSYDPQQQISLSTATDSAVIYYTTDGNDPTQSSYTYSQPIILLNNMTIKAIAYRRNYNNSNIALGNYYISKPVLTPIIKTDSVWIDSTYSGYAKGFVDGSGSKITYGSIYSYTWTVNGDSAGAGQKVNLRLKTGTNKITLYTVSPDAGNFDTSVYINVYAAKMQTGGAVYSGATQKNDTSFYIASTDHEIYVFDSTGYKIRQIGTSDKIFTTVCIYDEDHTYFASTNFWTFDFDRNYELIGGSYLDGAIISSPSVSSDDHLYEGTMAGSVYGFEKAGNFMIWKDQTNGAIISSPAVAYNGDIYVGSCDDKLYSISPSGQLNWTYATGDSIISSPAIGDDSSIVFGSNDGYLYKLDPMGKKIWSFNIGGKIKSSPIIADNGKIIFGSSNNKITCLDKTGSIVLQYNTKAPVNGTAAISDDGQILIGDDSGTLYCLNEQGSLQWYFKSSAPIESPVLITDHNLAIFGNTNGDVYTLKLEPNGAKSPAHYEWRTFKGNNQRTGNKSVIITDVKNETPNRIKEFMLFQNYPNPFNPTTIINYSVPKTSLVTIKLYDVLGREIEILVNEERKPGSYSVQLSAVSSQLSSGVYFYKMEAGGFVDTKKLILMK